LDKIVFARREQQTMNYAGRKRHSERPMDRCFFPQWKGELWI